MGGSCTCTMHCTLCPADGQAGSQSLDKPVCVRVCMCAGVLCVACCVYVCMCVWGEGGVLPFEEGDQHRRLVGLGWRQEVVSGLAGLLTAADLPHRARPLFLGQNLLPLEVMRPPRQNTNALKAVWPIHSHLLFAGRCVPLCSCCKCGTPSVLCCA